MPAHKTFTTRPDRWDENTEQGRTLKVINIRREDTEGNLHPGIGVFALQHPKLLLSPEDALKLAHQLADALERHRQREAA